MVLVLLDDSGQVQNDLLDETGHFLFWDESSHSQVLSLREKL